MFDTTAENNESNFRKKIEVTLTQAAKCLGLEVQPVTFTIPAPSELAVEPTRLFEKHTCTVGVSCKDGLHVFEVELRPGLIEAMCLAPDELRKGSAMDTMEK